MSEPERQRPPGPEEGAAESRAGEGGAEAAPAGHPGLRLFWKLTSISLGGSLVVLGVVGLFLPILQGWLMIFTGLAILSPHSRRARRLLRTLKAKIGWKEGK